MSERAGATFSTAAAQSSGDLAEAEDELFRFGQIVSGDPKLAAVVGDSSVDPARRAVLSVQKILGG